MLFLSLRQAELISTLPGRKHKKKNRIKSREIPAHQSCLSLRESSSNPGSIDAPQAAAITNIIEIDNQIGEQSASTIITHSDALHHLI